MDHSEYERLVRHYAGLTDDELRVAYGHGPAGYRDQETWEIVNNLHQERFGSSPTSSEPVLSDSHSSSPPGGHERAAPAADSPPPQPANPYEGALPFEILGVLLLGWFLPDLVAIKVGSAFQSVAGMVGHLVSQVGLIGVMAYLLWRRQGSLQSVGLGRMAWTKELRLAGFMLVALLAAALVSTILIVALGLPVRPPYDSYRAIPSARALAFIPLTLLVAASYEEFLFRAYLITRLRDLGRGRRFSLGVGCGVGVDHCPDPPARLSVPILPGPACWWTARPGGLGRPRTRDGFMPALWSCRTRYEPGPEHVFAPGTRIEPPCACDNRSSGSAHRVDDVV
jgi:membrane protease YdiL (CAAX protease family)